MTGANYLILHISSAEKELLYMCMYVSFKMWVCTIVVTYSICVGYEQQGICRICPQMIMHTTLAEVRLFSTPGDGSTNIDEENFWVLFFFVP